ncbi:hypothetical protein D9611_010618 [Ephemerocybe angulata]|uniref:F-box domain-containing protein n=1 Tax=Ephemerocybe angulata TaxID=980116 RepID=A0A8H5BVT9_9AGAR|nr:hypothetical protein D9611_010618 [Tulosesus angulatus]
MDPFAQYLNTNHIPTEEELVELKKVLLPDETRLASIEIELEDLARAMEKLKEEKATILLRTRALRALTSLIRRLPTPIMEAIFLFSFPSKPISPISISDPPLVFLRVCRPWRNMAMEMPRLWADFTATVPFQLFHTKMTAVRSFEAELSRWLERSGCLPLTVQAHMPYGFGPSPVMEALSRVARLAAKHSDRWESLDFKLCRSTLTAFRNITELTALKSLVITSDSVLWPADPITDPTPFPSQTISDCYNLLKAPNLTRLQLWHNGSSLLRLSEFPAKLGRLTHLTFRLDRRNIRSYDRETDEPMFLRMVELLRQCSSLQKCALTLSPCMENGAAFSAALSPAAVVPNLESFYLEGCSKQMEMLIQSIHTPALRELHYYPDYSISPHSYSPILNFLRTSGHQVEVLHLDQPTLSTPGFYACMHSCPNLKQLELGPKLEALRMKDGPPPYITSHDPLFVFLDEHLGAMTPVDSDSSSCSCPRIEILRLHVKSRVSPSSVITFLKAKVKTTTFDLQESNRTLKELTMRQLPLGFPYLNITLKAEKEEIMPIADDLKEFVEAGVKLTLDGPSTIFAPTPFYGPTSPKVGYETDFESADI